jgi:hypothetical protein
MRILLFILLIASLDAFGQQIHGSVFNEKGDLLPFSSILVKGSTQGVSANSEGRFSINVKPGTYTLVCQHVGYQRQERKITIGNNSEEIIFILALQQFELKEITIKSGDEDPAYGIIRKAIAKRSFYNGQVKSFSCEAYIKGLVKLRHLPDRILGQKVPDEDRKEMRLDSSGKGIIFLSESVTKVANRNGKMKLEVISGRQSGSNGFGFNFPTFISLYENNVNMFTSQFNPRGFVSPIADNALSIYRYKFLGSFFEDGKEINSIRVIPRRSYEPAFSGIINITEDDWRIHSCDLLLTKTSQLEMLDTLHLTQIHVPITKDIWRVKNQLLHFNIKQFGIDAVGDFVNVYSKYDLAPNFPGNYFDRVIIKYDTAVNKHSSAYWDSIRPVPLEPEEIKDYAVKDSLFRYERDSVLSKRNIDSLKKMQGKITFKKIFLSGINRTHYSTHGNYRWELSPVLKSLQYNTVEGVVLDMDAGFQKYLKGWKTNLDISPDVRYGFSNKMLNAFLSVNFRTRENVDGKLKREVLHFAGGTRISQFDKESNITPLLNTGSTLLYGNNIMKTYRNSFGEISWAKRFESGIRIITAALYEDRKSLENTTDFILFEKNRSKFTVNYPYRISSSQFMQHQALTLSMEISIKPGQRYIQFPRSKVAIGSKYPTFTAGLEHGFKSLLGSDVDFDKWKFEVADDANLKLAGSIKYKLSLGGFMNSRKVFIQDYRFFNGNESKVAKDYMNTFQLLPYYSAFTTKPFYAIAHLEHHFNGLLTNKIPLFKKLNWNFLYGSNAFYAGSKNNYAEAFAGLENIFKVLRFDVVAGSRNGGKILVDFRLGFGGSIGGSMDRSRSRRPELLN